MPADSKNYLFLHHDSIHRLDRAPSTPANPYANLRRGLVCKHVVAELAKKLRKMVKTICKDVRQQRP